ncbi:MAG: ABC transporter ATP-binding protein [Caldicoprobacterales bacterium]|nr:ABC transporter ATP-binding protein [Clostridiales bacterium]
MKLININKYYGDSHILKDISLDINDGEFLTLLGPSGCGKTTLLRCIAGLVSIESGDILLRGESIKDLPANKRNVNTVFQNYALFPHLNVYDNVAYGPRIRKSMNETKLKRRVAEVLEMVQMSGYEERRPHQLSGGQMQRVAIARALINEPDILLLDEPLGALDLKLRKYMQTELAQLQKQTGTTFVYVTHDQEEALNMSDRIVVIHEGRILQSGSPREVYNNPRNLFIANFIGDRNIIKVKVLEKGDEYSRIRLGNHELYIRCSGNAECAGDMAVLAIHMDKMRISCNEMPNSLTGEVLSIHYAGSQIRTEVSVDGKKITVIEYRNSDCDYEAGDHVTITWEDSGAILLPMEDFEENGI